MLVTEFHVDEIHHVSVVEFELIKLLEVASLAVIALIGGTSEVRHELCLRSWPWHLPQGHIVVIGLHLIKIAELVCYSIQIRLISC